MPTQLTVFNDTLGLLGQGPKDSVDVASDDLRTLRKHWSTVVERCHEATGWDFAKVRRQLARQSATPTFRYSYYYSIPSDCLRILSLSQTGEVGDDLIDYEAEPGKIATNAQTLYCTYVSETSRDAVGRWSQSFAYYVACELAYISCGKINQTAEDKIIKERRKAKSDAIGLDATQGPPQRRRHGAWSRAARGFHINIDREQS